nr:acyltransferase family protein [Methanocella conradii]
MASLVVFHYYCCAFYPVLMFGAGTVYHIGPVEGWIAASPFNLFYNGGFEVCVFFVLSGYVLSNKFFASGERQAVISGAVRRYIRLMVLVLFAVVAAYVLLAGHLYFNRPASSITGSSWLASANSYAPGFVDALKDGVWSVFFENPNLYFDNALWTMAVEFTGSFLVFSFLMLFGDLKNR